MSLVSAVTEPEPEPEPERAKHPRFIQHGWLPKALWKCDTFQGEDLTAILGIRSHGGFDLQLLDSWSGAVSPAPHEGKWMKLAFRDLSNFLGPFLTLLL